MLNYNFIPISIKQYIVTYNLATNSKPGNVENQRGKFTLQQSPQELRTMHSTYKISITMYNPRHPTILTKERAEKNVPHDLRVVELDISSVGLTYFPKAFCRVRFLIR